MKMNYWFRKENDLRWATTLVVCLVAAGSVPARGSSVLPMNLQEAAGQASRVVVGRIQSITSYRDAQAGLIKSRIDVAETRSLSGAGLGTVTFEMAGGSVGDLRQWIAGFPDFQVGDHVVLFLAGETATPFGPTVGLWQGVFFVERDGAGVETVVDHVRRPITEIRGGEAVRAAAAEGRIAQPGGPRVSLDAFLEQVRAFRSPARGSDRR